MKLDSKENLLSQNLKVFYSQGRNLENVLNIVDQKTTISLRLLDWLVANYSKKNKVFYELSDTTIDGHTLASQGFDMYSDYKNQLKASNKKYFDPFSRSQRIYIYKTPDNVVEYRKIEKSEIELYKQEINNNTNGTDGTLKLVTTIGQLNFFKWAITYGVINYATENRDSIEQDMLKTVKERKKNKSIDKKNEENRDREDTDQKDNKQKRILSKTNHITRSSSKKIIVQFV